ncbi:MAG: 2-C-methyl-D-erythritol 4-phosphate cytidylyltransferase [Parachlamydiales bacterium]|jgi:2-C-methyl-D-erythritol 4-phosphate cytidylyltransferase
MQVAILLMAGDGRRFQSETPKQFHLLSGKPVYLYALEALKTSAAFDLIILCVPKNRLEELRLEHQNDPQIKVVSGGKTRQESSYRALLSAPAATRWVLIHDGVRPFLNQEIIAENLKLVKKHRAVDTCLPTFDTIVYSPDQKKIARIPNRQTLLRGQTPQTFEYKLLLKAHQLAQKQPQKNNASDDCQLVLAMGKKIFIAKGAEENLKITTPLDLFLAEQIFRLKTCPLLTPPKTSLAGKKYLVIGASGGIGSQLCLLLKKAGAAVFPISRSSAFSADLRKKNSLRTTLDRLFKLYGASDGLINLAGFLKTGPLKQLSLQEIEDQIQINLNGLVLACRWAKIKPGGQIVNVASSAYAKGRSGLAVYSASKAAVVNFTQALAEEEPALKINVLVPPRTDTLLRRTNFPNEDLRKLLSPKAVARAIVALLKSSVTGSIIEIKKSG